MTKRNKLTITIVSDNPNSWIHPYAKHLIKVLKGKNYNVRSVSAAKSIKKGDIAVYLSCESIVGEEILKLSTHNLVVHESKLPKGKGMSPLTWQIIEGINKIPITLFEAVKNVDAGDIYLSDHLLFEGHELVDELREKQGKKTIDMVLRFVDAYPNIKGHKQVGESTYYRRRGPKDSELDISKSIKEQFNILRVVDNERYPATFTHKGKKYRLQIDKINERNG